MTTEPHSYSFAELGHHVGITLSPSQAAQLERYLGFLATEAMVAGGIGPGETERLVDRHVADSMMFLAGIGAEVSTVTDVGSGVGLPGIPIAVCRPDTVVTLVDRAQRGTDLARRAVRILGLGNVSVRNEDASRVLIPSDIFTFRASFPVDVAAAFIVTQPVPATGLLGVSRQDEQPEIPPAPSGVTYTLTEESKGVLDSPFWLLRMTTA